MWITISKSNPLYTGGVIQSMLCTKHVVYLYDSEFTQNIEIKQHYLFGFR
jgi:hypothetical protein